MSAARTISAPRSHPLGIALLMLLVLTGCQQWRRRSTVSQLAESREFVFEGQRQSERGEWSRAESLFRDAVDACPQDERAHGHLAEALWQQGAAQDAIETQRKAVELSAGEARHRVRLGEMYLEAGKVIEALVEADAALARDRTSTAAWNLRSLALERLGRRREALACLQRSLAADDSQAWVYEQIATLYEASNDPQRALATWQAYEDRFPAEDVPAEVLRRQALAMQRLERPREAIERLVEARRRAPDSYDILIALADLQFETGDRANAQLTLSHLRKAYPQDAAVESVARRWSGEASETLRR